ncbi:MAG: hypothetical protein D9V44_06605 [Actinobacteria bacterium]|nr:MAG: hypothetical protein D9V44_06605 [Actinomycetota bacterium]
MRVRYEWFVVVTVAAAVTVGGFMLLSQNNKTAAPTATTPDATPTPASSSGTGFAGVAEAPKVVDIPTPPSGIAQKVAASGSGGLSAEELAAWNAYLAETEKIVREHGDDLRTRVDGAVVAIKSGDRAALGGMFARDESVPADFADKCIRAYPRIHTYEVQSSVGVFSVANATVYFGYAVVQWEDGGIVSTHTIAIPMRFVDDTWYLTSIGSSTKGIASVQSVKL